MTLRIIIPSLGRGGAEQFSIELLKALSKLGCSANLLSLTNSRNEIELQNLPVILLKNRKAKQSLFYLLALRMRRRSEIWLSTGLQANLVCIFVCFVTFSLSKLIVRFNNPIENDLHLVKNFAGRVFLQLCLRRVRKVVFQSESMEDTYKEHIKFANSVVIPNFTRFTFSLGSLDTDTHIQFVNISRFEDQKDHFFFIKIAKLLVSKNIKFKFSLYGTGLLLEEFRQALDEADLNDYFTLHGSLPREQIIIPKNAIYMQASKFEGFPNSIVEALNTGLLVYDFTENFYSRELLNHPNYYKFEKAKFKIDEVLSSRQTQNFKLKVGQSSDRRYLELCQ